MSTIVVTTRRIERLEHGYDLRVANLCRQLGTPQHLLIVPLEDSPAPEERTIDMGVIFESVTDLGDADLGQPRWLRHGRLSEENYLRRAHPHFFARAVRTLRETMHRTGADRLVFFGSSLAGVAAAAGTRRVLFDVCDSVSLTLRRQLEFDARAGAGGRSRLAGGLALRRWRVCEGRLPRAFAQVTTINEADSNEVRDAAGEPVPQNVHTVPNGVAEALVGATRDLPQDARAHGVAFWGNLGFAPNREALRWFLGEVYEPHLRSSGIEVCIIGRDAEPWLMKRAQSDANIKLLGFADDLALATRCYPVMINPMVIGSGMKNKVLEAFALGLAVVSTSLGMESIAGAAAGTHCFVADQPAAFAHAIQRLCAAPRERAQLVEQAARLVGERYTWSAIGAKWRALHDRLDAPAPLARETHEASIA